MVASVPEFTSRTISMEGTASRMASASSTSCFGGRAETGADGERALERLEDRRMAMAQQQRSPGADVIDVALPSTSKMCDPSPRAMNTGLPPTLRKRAHRRIDAAGNEFLRAAEELFGLESCESCWRFTRGTMRLKPRLMPMS
jgi:hypothetical protein